MGKIKFNLMLWLKHGYRKFLVYLSIFFDCHSHAINFYNEKGNVPIVKMSLKPPICTYTRRDMILRQDPHPGNVLTPCSVMAASHTVLLEPFLTFCSILPPPLVPPWCFLPYMCFSKDKPAFSFKT